MSDEHRAYGWQTAEMNHSHAYLLPAVNRCAWAAPSATTESSTPAARCLAVKFIRLTKYFTPNESTS